MTEENNYSKLNHFISDFKVYLKTRENERLNNEIGLMHPVFNKLIKLDRLNKAYIKEHLPHFNIFNVMRYGNKETRLHTPFLRYLIDPESDHYFGDIFAKQWIAFSFDSLELNQISKITIQEEKQYCGLGQIDLMMIFNYQNKKYYLAIENKLDAIDQTLQLERYHEVLKILSNNDSSKSRLIYLTKDGRKPSHNSINEKLRSELEQKKLLLYIDYKNSVSKMISDLIKLQSKNNFQATLIQYQKTISNF